RTLDLRPLRKQVHRDGGAGKAVPVPLVHLWRALDDPDLRVRRSALHTLSCQHCKPSGCAPEVQPLFERMARILAAGCWAGSVTAPGMNTRAVVSSSSERATRRAAGDHRRGCWWRPVSHIGACDMCSRRKRPLDGEVLGQQSLYSCTAVHYVGNPLRSE